MKKCILLLFVWIPSFGQTVDLKSQAKEILEKGNFLHSLIEANIKTLELTQTSDLIFSYKENEQLVSIVFPAEKSDKIIRTITYDWPALNIVSDNSESRETESESLYKKMVLNIFATTNFFPLPKPFWALIEKGQNGFLAYCIPRQESNEELVLGNDFYFEYKANGEFNDFKFLHNNAIHISTKFNENESVGTMHTHANRNDDFITALDVATILSYKEKLNWNQHLVVSRKYVSTFDIVKMTLEISTKKDYETRTGRKL